MRNKIIRNIVTVGSCLSSITAEHLKVKFGLNYIAGVHHNRSDSFLMYHVNKTNRMIPYNELSWFVPDPKFNESPNEFLKNQYGEFIGKLASSNQTEHVQKTFDMIMLEDSVDIFLLDNFMDISAKLMHERVPGNEVVRPLFLNPHFYTNSDEIMARFDFGEFLTAEASAANWFEIIKWIKRCQPQAVVYFLCFPYCTSLKSPERAMRARDFYVHLSEMTKDVDVHVLPPPNVAPELTAGDDWYHLGESIYVALAGYIFLSAAAGLPPIGRDYQITEFEICDVDDNPVA